MSDTMLDILRARAEQIIEEGIRLLKDFSGTHPANKPGDEVLFISGYGDNFWDKLPPGGKQIQAQLLPEIDQFAELICVLTLNLPHSSQQELEYALEKIRKSVEQDWATYWKTKDEAVEGFKALLSGVITTIEGFYGTPFEDTLVISDTNALLRNPDIEHWEFDNIGHFTIILTPTVLSELYVHKIKHRNEEVRNKATKIVRKIMEYRRRGSLLKGVAIVKDNVSLMSIAIEPDMSQTLSWFDPNNADDRFLATTIEVIRSNLVARVFIVTKDINMQNKAEMAGIPFREVPIPRTEKEEK